MAETHKEVVKVWIAPGCIVCDACETDCPEVFDVQEETCIIRPPALKQEFTKPLTPSIMVAAEGCPVDVIKFDLIDVEGPEPAEWKAIREGGSAAAGHGATAGAAAGGGSGGGGAAVAVSREAPDPKWISFLEAAHVSGSRSAGGPAAASVIRSAKVSAEAIAMAMPAESAPDGQFAMMVGTGMRRPKASVEERIRERAAALSGAKSARETMTRRSFSLRTAWSGMLFVSATSLAWFQSFMVPKAPIEPPTKVRVGRLQNFTELGVYEDFKGQNIWIVTLDDEGVRKAVAINTVCTHLGCIPNWLAGPQIFKCPCHGSGFRKTGVNFEGPAPRPLERFAVDVDASGTVIVDKGRVFRYELGQWRDPESFRVIT